MNPLRFGRTGTFIVLLLMSGQLALPGTHLSASERDDVWPPSDPTRLL